jgi:hypothetical protein
MKLFIICSKAFYTHIPSIQKELETMGHTTLLPNSYDDMGAEERQREKGVDEHAQWKAEKFRESKKKIETIDAVLVLNFEKHGMQNYIGGATFLEIYDAYCLGKKIFFYNPIPEGILYDELCGFAPTIIHGDVSLVQ